jgi:hypothetical protein
MIETLSLDQIRCRVVPPFRSFVAYLRRDQMRLHHTHCALLRFIAGFGLFASMASAQGQSNFEKQIKGSACPNDDSALKLPPGFCASVFADGIGHARHLVVSAAGLVYVNTWLSPYHGSAGPHPGGFLEVLQDKTGAGRLMSSSASVKPLRVAEPAARVSLCTRAGFTRRLTIES